MAANANSSAQIVSNVVRYARASLCILGVILASGLARAGDPPPNLIKLVAARETDNEAARNQYMYRRTVVLDDYSGEYREVRDVVFSPSGERSEEVVGKPSNSLRRLKLTDEDFRDIREVQPMLVTRDNAFLYESKFRGEDTVDGIDCWLLEIRPRQILSGQRLFDGTLWVDKRDYSVIRLEGQAVPQIRTTKEENLFPRFTTVREKMDGKFWFPVTTYGDDTLYFRTGPQRVRLVIRYANYRRFGTETKIEYK